MPNISKIIKYNLEEETLDLYKTGISLDTIAEVLRQRYPDNEDLEKLSSMSIHRFLESHKEKIAKEKFEESTETDLLAE